MDLQNLPEGTPVWLTVVGVLVMLFVTLSERLAKLSGPLGAAARWWNSRAIRQVQQKKRLDAEIEKVVDARVEARMEAVDGTIDALKRQVAQLRSELETERRERREERVARRDEHDALIAEHRRELTRLRAEDQSKYRYILYLSDRIREYRLWAAEHGYTLPPPPIPPYYDWVRERESKARNPPD